MPMPESVVTFDFAHYNGRPLSVAAPAEFIAEAEIASSGFDSGQMIDFEDFRTLEPGEEQTELWSLHYRNIQFTGDRKRGFMVGKAARFLGVCVSLAVSRDLMDRTPLHIRDFNARIDAARTLSARAQTPELGADELKAVLIDRLIGLAMAFHHLDFPYPSPSRYQQAVTQAVHLAEGGLVVDLGQRGGVVGKYSEDRSQMHFRGVGLMTAEQQIMALAASLAFARAGELAEQL